MFCYVHAVGRLTAEVLAARRWSGGRDPYASEKDADGGRGDPGAGGNGYINDYATGGCGATQKLYEIGAGVRNPPDADRPRALQTK
jgi:hypothetical protein